MSMHGQSKSRLHELFTDKNGDKEYTEDEKIFNYCNLKFKFKGTSQRTIEKFQLLIIIPDKLLKLNVEEKLIVIFEDYLLRHLFSGINSLSEENANINKGGHEKADFAAQSVNGIINHRSGMIYYNNKKEFIFKIAFSAPLTKGISVNSKSLFKAIKSILDYIEYILKELDTNNLLLHLSTYDKQLQIREYLRKNHLSAFVADGSILPRENGTSAPMKNAIPFKSPDSMYTVITFSDGTSISGMAIPQGIIVITGGGYSGKSTLLDAIEMGIYNHITGDGREYVITDDSTLKIYAEDGRPINNVNISPFFKYLPNDINIDTFSTSHASGSVSQAANIIEAVCAGTKLLLIDEDKSATNFMIRDANMRRIVKKEPIIPFTDRVRELYSKKGVSTILVIGGSSEYLRYADTVILMDDYVAKDITIEVKSGLDSPIKEEETSNAIWAADRFLIPQKTTQSFLYFRSINTENAKKIILDEYSSDITLLTAIISDYQLNSLAFFMEKLLTDKEADHNSLIGIAKEMIKLMFEPEISEIMLPSSFHVQCWFEAVRPIDISCCVNRMRGLNFKNK